MSNQKHTVSTDALDTLGTCPIPENSGRDAIHLAVEPIVAGTVLHPGQRIRLLNGNAFPCIQKWDSDDATGIVDPFIKGWVEAGEKFWFVVLPRTITSLHHVWSHPAFPEAATYNADDKDEHYLTSALWAAALDTSENVSKADMARFVDEVDGFNPEQSMAMAWMKQWCAEIGERYDYIMDGAKSFLERGDYTYGEKDSGRLEGVHLPPEFWDKYALIVGKQVPVNDRQDFFSCSC